MNFFTTSLDITAHPAVVPPKTAQRTEITSVSAHPNAVAPVSMPNYLGGATILLVLAGMITMAAQAAGFTSKSAKPSHGVVTSKNSSAYN